MPARALLGLAPHLPLHRPRAPARWWVARGEPAGDRVLVTSLVEQPGLPALESEAGLAAPCSLPDRFVVYLGLGDLARAQALAALRRLTPARLMRKAREFAHRSRRGSRQPLRAPHESLSALDRRRLALFAAALPLLDRARPWTASRPALVEVDAPALLDALGWPAAGLSGAHADAIDRRSRIAAALADGAAGVRLEVTADAVKFACASWPALRALLALFSIAWIERARPDEPAADAAAWIPVP